jgi:DNA-binding CsgD family transcriptional regulator
MTPARNFQSVSVERRSLVFSLDQASYDRVDEPEEIADPPPRQEPERSTLRFDELWSDLTRASLRFNSTHVSKDGCVVVFARCQPGQRQVGLTARELYVFQRTLLGHPQKVIAFEAQISLSTAANCVRSAMVKLGFCSRFETAPLAALVLNHECRQQGGDVPDIFAARGGEYVLARSANPDWSKLPQLTHSEQEICSMIIAGKSNLEIKALRRTALGTVQNQMAGIFRKMRVSGRFELLAALFRTASKASAPGEVRGPLYPTKSGLLRAQA